MGKGHRDNHAARKKRGQIAFDKKKKRRAPLKKPKCVVCGNPSRPKNLVDGVCVNCLTREMEQSSC